MRFFLFGLLAVVSVNSFAAKSNLCWTTKIENQPDGIHVYVMKDYVPRISLQRRETTTIENTHTVDDGVYFVMQEGDTAYLQGGPHDNCTLVAERQGTVRGVRIKAVFRPSGLPPDEREEFVPGEPAGK